MQIAVLATQDTKSAESEYVVELFEKQGLRAKIVDTRPLRWTQALNDRGATLERASEAIRDHVLAQITDGEISGLCVLAGASGAALTGPLLSEIPDGFPSLLVSPVASSTLRPYIGSSSTVVIPTVVDFGPRNAYLDFALGRAVSVLTKLVNGKHYPRAAFDHFAGTSFGVVSRLVDGVGNKLRDELNKDLALFSANGTGGEAYERFVASGLVSGALDMTLSELADEFCGGVLSAGSRRGWAAGSAGIPFVMAPGALDFVNFGPPDSVPDEFKDRPTVHHTPSVTLVRTNEDDNFRLGQEVGARVSSSQAGIVLIPTKGFSVLSAPGGPFWDPAADDAFTQGIQTVRGATFRHIEDEMNGAKMIDATIEQCKQWKETK